MSTISGITGKPATGIGVTTGVGRGVGMGISVGSGGSVGSGSSVHAGSLGSGYTSGSRAALTDSVGGPGYASVGPANGSSGGGVAGKQAASINANSTTMMMRENSGVLFMGSS
ncbi:MAG: hypothetical protein GY792_33010, partial [Gammaproteobacteria bacterium]|nr:hypothetical protein [Gammaproteobacteria bacterium]